MSNNLYQRYRPRNWDDVLGNKEMLTNLRRLIEQELPPHAYLLTGPTGCGKTTVARIAAHALGCAEEDFTEVDSADFRGIDMVRELRHKSMFKGLRSPRRVWLLDEAHKLTNDAQNALLKLLEEPPSHCFYFLATTDPDRLLSTVRGRCIPLTVEPLSMKLMIRLLAKVSKLEGYHMPVETLRAIAEKHSMPTVDVGYSDDAPACYPRFALQLLAKLLVTDEAEHQKLIEKDDSVRDTTKDLVQSLLSHGGWKMVRENLVKLSDDDVESARWGCLNYCRAILLKGSPKLHDTAADIIEEMRMPFFSSGLAGFTLACYAIVKKNG